MKKIIRVALFSLICAGALAQSVAAGKQAAGTKIAAAPAPDSNAGLPTEAQFDAAMKRTFGYDPAFQWQVLEIRPSLLPGVAEVLVSINKQGPVRLFIPADGKNVIVVNDVLPFGADPFAPARGKLQAADGPSRGAANPQIMIVGFSDLECPHCKAAEPVLDKLVNDFPRVRFVFQQFPLPATLHPWAMKAALYADCAGRMDKDAFWKYVNAIFENQGGIALATAADQLTGFANTVGLNGSKVAACAATPETEARVKKSMELGESLEINETPTVFVNGRRVKSIASIPYEQLKAMVQFEIDHAGK
ncbi:MAG TPA: thioredoxin domain-containing protein [Candidatus Angelobacter sp.]|nr:thioredoxin domain-containing protein [Candidatus Angelobacter sp.]